MQLGQNMLILEAIQNGHFLWHGDVQESHNKILRNMKVYCLVSPGQCKKSVWFQH